MRSATRAEIITSIRQQGAARPTRLHLGKIRPIASLAEIATVFDGFREVHVAEHHSEIAACDWLEARGIHPVARHRLITIALSMCGARRAGITHLPDNTVRVRVYTLAPRKG